MQAMAELLFGPRGRIAASFFFGKGRRIKTVIFLNYCIAYHNSPSTFLASETTMRGPP
jgi:hypothetical protein